ncbi:hypothetical protein [Mucilaginibacter sp. FT3.2]|uniref:hypothetical protein n=1 Tax=Mucilaginibacter sp. FT3.2 TaxID=2723090 RepID=UPI00162139BB|nr:hypothetical protein [Mucilaginibacter sp. FT3.2]MBB6230862.1 hypothetical protein [Mucilaginibacter sp. FT3.2]
MKYALLLLMLFASPVAFCQYRDQPAKIIDTANQRKVTRHIYKFDGIVRKPWTFYKVVNGEFKALPAKEPVSNKIKRWNKFILTVRDITVNCVGGSANVIIIYNSSKSHYLLKQSAPNKFIFNDGTIGLMLIIKSSLVCEFYFLKENEGASVSNMDWEMAS